MSIATQITCLDCKNAILSPTVGVYCRLFSEPVDPEFAVECPGLEIA